MEYFQLKTEKPKTKKPKAEKKVKAEKKPKKARVPKLKLNEKKLDIKLFQGRTSKEREAFEKLKPTERLALIELEKLRREAKKQREKLVERTEEQKPKPQPLPLAEELALTQMRVQQAIVPRQADIKRIAELEAKLNPQPAIQAPPVAQAIQPAQQDKPVTSLTQYKRSVAFKSLPAAQKQRLADVISQLSPQDKRVFFTELTAKPVQAQITELRALLEPAVQVPVSPRRQLPRVPGPAIQEIQPAIGAAAVAPEPQPEVQAAPQAPLTDADVEPLIPPGFFDAPPEPGVVGAGLKVSKPVIKRIVKRVISKFDHPKDVAVILHTIRHPKLRVKMGSSGIEEHAVQVLERFVKHMKPKFSEKKTLKRDLKKAFKELF